MLRQLRRVLAALGAVTLLPVLAHAQVAGGTVAGRVVDRASQAPLTDVQVFVVGTQRGTRTDNQGNYRIAGVPAGTVQVRALRIGYEAATQSLTVEAGATATANFTLAATAVQLDAVVTTATGEQQRKRESGNSVASISTEDVALAAVPTMSALLNGRASGVTVLQNGGTTGSGTRVRIRGANSVNLSNEPLLIIDGVRVNNSGPSANSTYTIGIGGGATSRINDLNPEDIENIEVVKGPAASALYGTAAANGVLQITTKRGRAGKPQWTAFAEGGVINDVNDYPANYGVFNQQYGGQLTCFLADQKVPVAQGGCVADSLAVYSPLKAHSPFRTGTRGKYGLSVSGGSETARYYLSGDLEDEEGVYAVSNLKRVNVRSNVDANLRSDLHVQANAGYLTSDLQLPINDNSNLGVLGGALNAKPDPAVINDPTKLGYERFRPDLLFRIGNYQAIERFTGGLTGDYDPLQWLRFNGTLGYDVLNRRDFQLFPPNVITNTTANTQGSRTSNMYQIFNYTANFSGTATRSFLTDFVSTTTVGTQFQRENFTGTQAFGRNLLPGTKSLEGTNSGFAVGEDNLDNRTFGYVASEQVAWRDRLFVTGALRGDKNSAFGKDFGYVNYPSASLSYVISEEPWFPQLGFLSQLRLRSAYGVSGLRPGPRDAILYYDPQTVIRNVGGTATEVPAYTFGGLGNPNLKPERTAEVEYGFELGLLDNRVGFEATYYDKKSRDALVQRITPSSSGAPLQVYQNLGSVRNQGLELQLNSRILERENFAWEGALSAAWNKNRLVELGEGVDEIIFGLSGNTQQHTEGYPLGGYWHPAYTYADANKDGVIGYDEVQLVNGDSSVYLGSSLPTRNASLNTSVTLFKSFRLSALADYAGGHMMYNTTEEFRCDTKLNCRALYDPTTPLDEQAAAMAAFNFATYAGYIQHADFVKLREVALTISAPQSIAERFRARGLSLTLAGRNLHTWTKYKGIDPEVNFTGTSNFSQADFTTQPPVRYLTARVNVTF